MRYKNITDIFFDLDHTLWDFDKNSGLTFEKIFKINGVNIDVSEFLKHYEPINMNYWKRYREEKIDKESLRFARLQDTFQAVNISVEKEIIYQLAEDYITHLSSFNHLFEGTIELLEYLEPKYNLHIITNGFHQVQNEKLKNSNMDTYFKTVTNSETVGVKKPNPKIFNHALDVAKTTKAQSIMIGDNYEADILGALDFGIDAICFNYHKISLDSKIKKVDSLFELRQYL